MVDLGALVHDELGSLNRDNIPTLVVLLGLHLTAKTHTHIQCKKCQGVAGGRLRDENTARQKSNSVLYW